MMTFRQIFTRTPKPDLDSLRNEAVAAWIRTFPSEDRLTAFLANAPAPLREEIRQSAKQIYEAANEFLEDAAKAGDIDLDSFYPALASYLKDRFPWMQEAAFSALSAYTGWLSWHEGYLTKGD